jgi:Ribbon-helix-helix protein, copG family
MFGASMKSQRLTLLISPEDKRNFKSLAEDRGLSTSELVRQAVRAYGVNTIDDTRELAALTAEMRAALPAMRKSLRQANASVERTLASIASRKAAR